MKKKFIAEIKWGFADDSIVVGNLPTDFALAKRLWQNKDDKCKDLISKYLKCYFVPDNVDNVDEIFDLNDDIEAEEIEIYGVEFGDGELPRLNAGAAFNIPLIKKITEEGLDEWQEENDCLDTGVSFQWEIEGVEFSNPVLTEYEGLSFGMA